MILTVRFGVWAWVVWHDWIIHDFRWLLSRRDCCWSVQRQVWQENHHVHIWAHRFCHEPAGSLPWSFLALCAGQMCDWIWNRLVNWNTMQPSLTFFSQNVKLRVEARLLQSTLVIGKGELIWVSRNKKQKKNDRKSVAKSLFGILNVEMTSTGKKIRVPDGIWTHDASWSSRTLWALSHWRLYGERGRNMGLEPYRVVKQLNDQLFALTFEILWIDTCEFTKCVSQSN